MLLLMLERLFSEGDKFPVPPPRGRPPHHQSSPRAGARALADRHCAIPLEDYLAGISSALSPTLAPPAGALRVRLLSARGQPQWP